MLSPARIRCHRRKGIGRPGRRSVRPDPARTGSRLVPSAREYEPGHGQGPRPRPRYTAPPRDPLRAGGPGAGGAGRSWRPAFAKGMFLPAEVTRGAVITGKFPGNSAGDRRPAGRGRIRRGGRAGRRQGAGVLVTAMPRSRCRRRHHRDDAAEPAGDRASTGHVWITIWRRYGRDPFRIFSQPSQPNGICPGNRGWGRQGLPGHVRWHRTAIRRIAQFIDESCAQPPTLVISPGLA